MNQGRGRRIAVGATALVVVAAIAGGFYLLGRGQGSDNSAESAGTAGPFPSTAPSLPGPGGRGQAPEGGPQEGGPQEGGPQGGPEDGPQGPGGGNGLPGMPPVEDGYATDAASGISIPVPDGWKGQSGAVGAGVTIGSYKCPGDTTQTCSRGGVFSAPAAALKIDATTAKAAAQKDIEPNSKDAYGGAVYGAITSHQVLKSQAVTVAGQKGYLVRWKVVTSKGDDGYVQSLAFPSPASPKLMVVVRSGFDVNAAAPKLAVMDKITSGIKAASLSSGSTGQS